jgi:hypothetical protein
MSFKVGDTVVVSNNPEGSGWVEEHIGKKGIIKSIYQIGWDKRARYKVEIRSKLKIYFYASELELVNKNRQLTFIFHD